MIEVGVSEARNNLSALLRRVECGDEIIITRDGKPIASLVPLIPVVECSQAHGAIQRIRERISQIGPTAFEWDELKADRDSGRP